MLLWNNRLLFPPITPPTPWTPRERVPTHRTLILHEVYTYPLLKSKWSQDSYFCKYCDNRPAGCVPVAVAQFLSFFKKPSLNRLNGIRFDWDLIHSCNYAGRDVLPSEEAQDVLARYIRELGRMMGTQYYVNHSSTKLYKMEELLKRIAFPNANKVYYTLERGARIMAANQPFIINADSEISDSAHTWVIDGWHSYLTRILITRYDEFGNPKPEEIENEYQTCIVHCNFGWGGLCDGYYNNCFFDARKKHQVEKEIGDVDGTWDRSYKSGFTMIVY